MSRPLVALQTLSAMSDRDVDRVRELEAITGAMPQAEIATHHVLHAGLYARTVMIPAGVAITGALIDVATTLIVSGDCTVHLGEHQACRLAGHHVLPASAHRKQAFFAHADTYLTMVFATDAQSVEEAEDEFTSEAHRLMSRQQDHANTIIVTGE